MRPRSLDDFLKNAHVPFTTFRHAEAFSAQREAAASHVPGHSWAKTVVCFAEDEPIAAVVPACRMVDLERLRQLAGTSTLRLASEAELAALCPDCEMGAVSPLTGQSRWRVFVDQSFVGEPEMVLCAGTHTDAIRMHFGDFVDLTRAVVGPISTPRPAPHIDPEPRRPRMRPSNRPSQGSV